MAFEFRNEFKELPVPEQVQNNPEEYDNYIAWVEDNVIYPFEDKAIAGFQFSLDLAHRLKVYNEWSKKSAKLLSRLSPDAWPVTSEEGVNTEHQGELLVEGKFVLGAMERGPKDAPKAPDAGEGSPAEGDGGADTPAEDTPAEEAPAAEETQKKDGEGESAEKAAEEASASN